MKSSQFQKNQMEDGKSSEQSSDPESLSSEENMKCAKPEVKMQDGYHFANESEYGEDRSVSSPTKMV